VRTWADFELGYTNTFFALHRVAGAEGMMHNLGRIEEALEYANARSAHRPLAADCRWSEHSSTRDDSVLDEMEAPLESLLQKLKARRSAGGCAGSGAERVVNVCRQGRDAAQTVCVRGGREPFPVRTAPAEVLLTRWWHRPPLFSSLSPVIVVDLLLLFMKGARCAL
jgi:hypothetical protein